jgi:hypothetical protein
MDDPEELLACTLSPVDRLLAVDSLPAILFSCSLAAALGSV